MGYQTVSGSIASFTTDFESRVKNLKLNIDPIQDLHGYDSPWPSGGGKNKFDKSTLSEINAYTHEASGYFYTDVIALKPNTAYTISPSSSASLGVSDYYVLFINASDDDPDALVITNAQVRYPVQGGLPKTIYFTTGPTGTIRFGVISYQNVPKASALEAFMTINYQLEEGSTATAWTPYSNECPISGWDSVTVWRTGENLADLLDLEFNDTTYSHSFDITNYPKLKEFVYKIASLIGQTVMYTVETTGTPQSGYQKIGAFRFLVGGTNVQAFSPNEAHTITSFDPSTVSSVIIYGNPNGASAKNLIVSLGSTPTPYSPYQGSTIPITIPTPPGTVYGGYIHTKEDGSAELVVDRAMASAKKVHFSSKITGTVMDYRQASPFPPTASLVHWNQARQQQISNMARIANPNSESNYGNYVTVVFTLVNTDVGSLLISEDLYQSMSDDDEIEVVYKLLNPLTYTLSPIALNALLGQNNIWCNSGSISLDYLAGIDSKPLLLKQKGNKTGSIVSFDDALAAPLRALTLSIDPVQDLHGYDSPWPAGGGKNKWHLYANGYYNSAGGFTPSGSNGCSDKIQVTVGATYVFGSTKATTETLTLRGYFFDENDAIVGSQIAGSSGSKSVSFTAPSGAVTVALWFSESGWTDTMTQTECDRLGMQMETGSSLTTFSPYSNLCPISGWTEANLWRTGKNLFDPSGVENGSYDQTTGEKIPGIQNQQRSTYYVKCSPGQLLTQDNSAGLSCRLFFYLGDTYVSTASFTSGSTITVPNGVDRFRFTSGTAPFSSYTNLQIELSSTPTSYAPYTGTTYPITIPTPPGTVYGGYISVGADGSAELVVDRKEVDLGTLDWTYDSLRRYFRTSSFAGIITGKPYSAIICDQYATKAGVGQPNADCQIAQNSSGGLSTNIVNIRDTRYTDATVFTAALDGVKAVYELATPITIPLSDIQVQMLKKDNSIWADSGDITITYDRLSMLFMS